MRSAGNETDASHQAVSHTFTPIKNVFILETSLLCTLSKRGVSAADLLIVACVHECTASVCKHSATVLTPILRLSRCSIKQGSTLSSSTFCPSHLSYCVCVLFTCCHVCLVCSGAGWKCCVCNCSIEPSEMVVDTYLNALLQSLGERISEVADIEIHRCVTGHGYIERLCSHSNCLPPLHQAAENGATVACCLLFADVHGLSLFRIRGFTGLSGVQA